MEGANKIKLLEESAAKKQARIDRCEEVIVGVNKYNNDDSPEEIELLVVDHKKVIEEQLNKLSKLKKERDDLKVKNILHVYLMTLVYLYQHHGI